MFNKDQNDFENQQMNGDLSVSGVETITKKSKGKKAALIGGITAAVVVGGGAAAYGLSDTVKNQVKLRLSSPEKYYAWVTENNSQTIGESVSEYYKKTLDRLEGGQTSDLDVSFAPSSEAKEKLIDSIFGSSYNADDQKLVDIINDNESFGLSAEYSSKKGKMSADVAMSLNGDRLVGADVIMDNADMDYFFRVPELKDQWIGVEAKSVEEELVSGSSAKIIEAYKDILEDPTEFLSPEELETEVNRYAKVWGDFAKDVEIEKKEDVDICDITVNYTVASMDLTEEDLAKLGMEMLKELRDDKIIKDILSDKLDVVGEDEFEDELKEEIDRIKDDIKDDYYDDDETVISVDTYIDFTGTIRGFKLYNDDDYIFAAIGKDGDDIRGEVTFAEDGEDKFSAKLSAVEDHKKFSGDLELTFENSYSYDDEDDDEIVVSVVFEDFEIVDEEKGYFNGDLTVTIPKVSPFTINCSADKDGQNISCDINVGGTNYGRLSVDYSVEYKADIDIPDKDDAFMIDIQNAEDLDIEDYASKDDVEDFVKDILVKVGFDDKDAAKYAEEIAEGAFDDFDLDLDEFDLDDDDDYDFDFDDDDDYDFGFDDDDDYDFGFDDDDDDYDFDFDDDKEYTTSAYEFSFDPDSFKYEDYKNYMTEEEFNDMVDELKKYYDEYNNSQKKAS
ncbi:hypothetical protein [uncultured Ruminococcus sp.]|uniref:hypothetical protein n=1 Tax=uncultured Ruminococcus sp. TaxID=165186 RepID=UPI0026142076|nr:hypothetical protein [uncultured Ruminococcus sp.]